MAINIYEETISTELKEFVISDIIPFIKQEDYEKFILSGKMYSNKQVLKSLEIDFIKYIPKYLSSWNHMDLNLDYGKMFFGIKDNGDIVGIPFNGILTVDMVKTQIFKTKKLIKTESNLDKLFNSIKISVDEINPPEIDILKKYNDLVCKYDKSIKKHKSDVSSYLKWHEDITRWRCKLIDILNNEYKRDIFLNWLRKNCVLKLEQKKIIVKQVEEWKHTGNFNVSCKDVKKDNTTLIHWLCLFKDIYSAVEESKPIIRTIKKINWKALYHYPYYMNYHIGKHNPGVRFYIIKCELPNLKKAVMVKKDRTTIQYYRTKNKTGPASIPVIYK